MEFKMLIATCVRYPTDYLEKCGWSGGYEPGISYARYKFIRPFYVDESWMTTHYSIDANSRYSFQEALVLTDMRRGKLSRKYEFQFADH